MHFALACFLTTQYRNNFLIRKLGELKTRADDDSDMGVHHSDKGLDLAHELSKENSGVPS